MKYLNQFLMAVLAGVAISIGGAVFLSLDDKVLGALFFCVGLFTICTVGLNLFTGKVCALPDQCTPAYLGFLVLVWVGNLTGTVLSALCLRCTRSGAAMAEKAADMAAVKTGDSLLSLFILGVFCNILIYLAVDGFQKNPHTVGKYLGLFFGVTVFILAGFEHCVADMFYFTMAGAWTPRTVLCLLVITLGNAVGGMLFPLCFKLREKAAAKIA